MNALQGGGSTETYLKRYTGFSILGLSSGDEVEDAPASENGIEYFFEHYYAGYLNNYRVCGTPMLGKHLNLIVFLTIFVVSAYFGSQIKPASKASSFLPDDHPLQKFFTFWRGDASPFRASDQDAMVQLDFVFGLQE